MEGVGPGLPKEQCIVQYKNNQNSNVVVSKIVVAMKWFLMTYFLATHYL